ncbi:unnamed protein product [Ambrosiozyma monospora]|uniref:Unnamed protein product n=1 Tax=Ambrosiozyma monospora TaxID=43982 RepID=A0ACB5TA94_AMBMO|nr:unnamed protein product [Ambrosiozyma monospora]
MVSGDQCCAHFGNCGVTDGKFVLVVKSELCSRRIDVIIVELSCAVNVTSKNCSGGGKDDDKEDDPKYEEPEIIGIDEDVEFEIPVDEELVGAEAVMMAGPNAGVLKLTDVVEDEEEVGTTPGVLVMEISVGVVTAISVGVVMAISVGVDADDSDGTGMLSVQPTEVQTVEVVVSEEYTVEESVTHWSTDDDVDEVHWFQDDEDDEDDEDG